MTPLNFIAHGRSALSLGEIEVNKELARSWRADNPDFFGAPHRGGTAVRLRSRGTGQAATEAANG